MKKIVLFLLVFGTIAALTGVLNDEALAEDPGDVTMKYDFWLSATSPGNVPPYTPVHDCLVINYDGENLTMLLEGCPPAGPAIIQPGNFGSFIGIACSAYLVGYFLNGSALTTLGLDVIGGVMVRPGQKTWGFEGVRNDDCVP
jgi:hypothetical protein